MLISKIFAIALVFLVVLILGDEPVLSAAIQTQDMNLHDDTRNRDVPVRVYGPAGGAGKTLIPLIVFSHGGGESREAFTYFGQGLAEKGYIVVFLTHPGTDRAEIERTRGQARRIAVIDQFHLRPEDVTFVLDRVLKGASGLTLVDGRVDPDRVGLAGQCIGGLTVMLFKGLDLRLPGGKPSYVDPRIKAVLALGPAIGEVDPERPIAWHENTYTGLKGPLMVITGGRDFLWLPAVRANPALRDIAYGRSQGPDRFHVELTTAQHNAFTDSTPYYPVGQRDPRHHGWIVQASGEFFDAFLKGDDAALKRITERELEKTTDRGVTMRHSQVQGMSQAAPRADPPRPAPNAWAAVDEFLERNLERLGGGCSLILIQGDRVVHRAAYGSFTPDRVVPVASASKWISAGVIMALVDDGVLSLEDKAGRYLPEFTGRKGDITIRQMFSHTHGLSPEPRYNWDAKITMAEAVRSISTVKWVTEPGQGLYYSGAGMQVAGRMAEIATGRKWPDLFREKIGDPLGMAHTDYYAFGRTDNPNVPGSVRTNIDDFGAFVTMLLNKGVYRGRRVLSEAAVDEMFKNQTGDQPIVFSAWTAYGDFDSAAPSWRYGIGCWLEEMGSDGRTAARASSGGAFGCQPFVDRRLGLAGVYMPYSRNMKQDSRGRWYNEASVVYLELKEVIARRLASKGAGRPATAASAPGTPAVKPAGLQSNTEGVTSVETLTLSGPKPGQNLEMRLTYPEAGDKLPVILLSHLVSGNKDNFPELVRRWAGQGYLVIQPNHYDWAPSYVRPQRMELSRFPERTADLTFILNNLKSIEEKVPDLKGRIDSQTVGCSGFLIGAHSAGLLSGIRLFYPDRELSLKDQRIKAAVLLSPQGTGQGLTERSWLEIDIPMLVVAGSESSSRRTNNPPEWRCEPFIFAPPGEKYLLFMKDLSGYYGGLTFGGPRDDALAQPIISVTSAFWDAFLKHDAAAKALLKAGLDKSAWPKVERFEGK